MRVVTLDPERFEEACGRLGEIALRQGPYCLVVSIRNGGAHVADAIQRRLPQLKAVDRCDVSLQRVSTPRRTQKAGKWLSRLPRPLLNLLRIAESIYDSTTESREKNRELAEKRIIIPEELRKYNIGKGRILVVDDAVDSGVTLSVVKERLAQLFPKAEIMTAALTVTRRDPMAVPDFSLYSDRTLLRFPWSNDYPHD